MKKKIFYLVCLCSITMGIVSCNHQQEEPQNVVNEVTIYGNVIDRATGQPLYNVLIQEKNKVGGSTVTGNDGNYEFTLPLNGSSNGKYYLVASKDKYSSSEYELEMSKVDKNRRVKVDFQLTKESITYTGTVVDSKNIPIYDAHISAQYSAASGNGTDYNIGSTTMTDINGVYTLELPRPYPYNIKSYSPYDQWKFAITATKSGYVTLTHTLNQNVDDMGKTVTLNFVMKSNKEEEQEEEEEEKKKQVMVVGKVTNSAGLSISDAHLTVYSKAHTGDNGHYEGSTMTDTNGKYSITIVPTSYLTYYFHMGKDGFDTKIKTLELSSADAGKTYTLDFVLTKE